MAEDDQMANVKFSTGKKFGEWVIKKRLDEGGFGQVYLVENAKKEKAALKAESNEVEGGSAIKLETMILKALNKNGPQPHIPVVYHAAKRQKYCYMVMTLLGENLKHLKTDQPKEKFTRGTWSRLGIQCLYSLKYLHDCGFIHRDIKPQNFVMGHPEDGARARMVHILDFGLARPFASYNEKTNKWVARKARGTAEFRGTLRYTSPNVHNRKEQGRVDDVWSLLFVLIELNGGLPWQLEKDREKVELMKMNMEDRVVMQNMPICMGNILPHLKSLDYYQRPDYHLFFKSLWQVMTNEKVQTNSPYDWETVEQEELAPADWEKPDGDFFKTDPTGICGPPKDDEKKTVEIHIEHENDMKLKSSHEKSQAKPISNNK
ncbi:unnamed protein product [Caenorhabditis bovis]|uniref:non-specific serine/threonine protein kinase n=1 Tax=Caenorhabditis bovis TaxID=2654633 RepID=A0A8S1FB86_9PELO|nr:unnamed protein product [Caenorhabditis bovis]